MFFVLVFLLSAHRTAVSFTLTHPVIPQGYITMVTVVSKHDSLLSHNLSLPCFAETLDIIWPCDTIILGISRSGPLQ